jgi:uncharacterized protein YggU (UPF0235/DUF167 family)
MEIRVRVKTGSPRESIISLPDGRLEICVAAKPAGGRANERAIELIAARYRVPRGKIRIIKGQRSPTKLLSIGSR